MDLISQITELADEIGALIVELDKKRTRLDALTKQLTSQRLIESPHNVTENTIDEISEIKSETDADNDKPTDDGCEDDKVYVADSINVATTGRICISDIRRVLTLNDKFRFKRELFGNNDRKFSEALQIINSLKTEQEAEEFIASEIAPGNASETVEEFAEIIKRNISNKA